MLTELSIRNFKGWADTGTIRMAPITLFFGTNSSGKSSIGQFLMMLKQTVESSDRKAIFNPGSKNTPVNLGSYREMVFRRDLEHSIEFKYAWDLPEALKFNNYNTGESYSFTHVSFEASVNMDDRETGRLSMKKLGYILSNYPHDRELDVFMYPIPGKHLAYDIVSQNYGFSRNQDMSWHAGPPVRFYGFPDEIVNSYKNAGFIQQLNFVHERLFASISYLGPLRVKPDRLYTWSGITPDSVGASGENTVAAMLSSRDRRISSTGNQDKKPIEEIVAQSLHDMGLIDEFKVTRLTENRQEYEVKVRTRGSHDWVDLPDVGFGISQVLPVLVQCYYAPPHSIIIVEQPELHLHPSAQAMLADALIKVVESRENDQDRNIQLIIETHSEHFLRRLQRRIAEDSIPQRKVAAYFAKVDEYPARLETLQIDAYGFIKNWPANFFGDDMDDIMRQSEAAMEKRIRERNTSSDESHPA